MDWRPFALFSICAFVTAAPAHADEALICGAVLTREDAEGLARAVRGCQAGDVLFFVKLSLSGPPTLSHEVAAYACDFRYPVVFTSDMESLTCVYRGALRQERRPTP